METAYQAQSGHTTPDKVKELPWKVFHELEDTKIMVFTQQREYNDIAKPLPDLLTKGAKTLESSTLKTFNQKMELLRDGDLFIPEVDEIRIADFTLETAVEL